MMVALGGALVLVVEEGWGVASAGGVERRRVMRVKSWMGIVNDLDILDENEGCFEVTRR